MKQRESTQQGRSTHVFVDIATGQFVVRDNPHTTSKVQVVETLLSAGAESSLTMSPVNEPYNSPSDDFP